MSQGPQPPLWLRKSGNILEVSLGGIQPLPLTVRRLLEPILSYRYKKLLFGPDRFDPITGMQRSIIVTEKQLYRYDRIGRLICGFGLADKVAATLREADYPIELRNADPERARPRCFEFDKGEILRHFTYRERQEEAVDAILCNWGGVIHAVTGFGKMVLLAMACLAHPHAKIDVITKSTPIANKIYETLLRYLPNIGRIRGGRKDRQRITVYNADSLHHADFDADIILCDEVHELLADAASEHLARYTYSRMFGFTASPKGRLDGADVRLESLFGKTIFYLPYWEAVELGLVVPIRVEWSDVNLLANPAASKNGVFRKRYGVWRNDERNQIIAAKAKSFGEDEQVLVLVDTVEHAVHLRRHLPGYTLVYAPKELDRAAAYIADGLIAAHEAEITPAQAETLLKRFEAGDIKKVVATGTWATGIDPRQLTALVRAGTGSTETRDIQAPGRVSRTHSESGKAVGIVCDFRDQFDSGFADAAKKRRAHYSAMRWDQV